MYKILKISIFLFLLLPKIVLSQDEIGFSLSKECSKETCSIFRVVNNKKNIITSDKYRISDIVKINDEIYYFHISCGNPCGYGHYVTRNNLFITEDNEILFDEKRKCVVYAESDTMKIFYRVIDDKTSKEVYDFHKADKYNNSDHYNELLDMKPLHEIFKEDAFIDNKNNLHIYAFGYNSNLINISIKNIC